MTGEEITKWRVILKHFIRKLKAQYLQLIIPNSKRHIAIANAVVSNDVKEGQFAVCSVNTKEEPQRFVVELHWLTNPSFLKLLKQAEDEYGFIQKGAIEVPCLAEELQNVLQFKTETSVIAFAV
ncbi:auxin-responsive protein SAUR32-like [Nicotiana tabacum]|uniref:Auxin-responsive protein SAUR32-like n=2 Tax=Nicotiana TaxID=4085 RepID=A0A1S3ZWM2_TOBAC|nr:PREDICTED: auxin-induced protein 6B [Nicotiana sylvestris]XP_016468792.1 PREDICTED: auxin-responsive protein SAUR32-like [Nicotiana tabacum]